MLNIDKKGILDWYLYHDLHQKLMGCIMERDASSIQVL